MYHSHAFVPDVLFTNSCVLYESVKVSLKEKLFVCVVDIISVQASSWALTISTLVLSVQVLEGSFKEGRGWVLQ